MSSSQIRVASVIEEGKLGGPQQRMVRVAVELAGRAETLIVMPQTNSTAFRHLCEEQSVPYSIVALTRITREWRAALGYLVFSPVEVMRLARLFRDEGVHLVHASGGSWQYKAVIAAWLAGIPAVWHLNDTLMPGWVRTVFQLVQPLASGFIYTSLRVKDYYGVYISHNRPVVVVPPPIDAAKYNPLIAYSGDDGIVEEFGDDLVIGTVGNVSPIKGLETLLHAAARLRSFGYAPHLVIVGPIFDRQRGYYHRLLALASKLGVDRVHFVGARQDVRPLLARLDVYVCPSVSESWGMALWESMAMARPIVSTDVGDVARHVRDGEEGFVVPVGDAEAMAERIVRLLEDAAMRKRMGQQARRAAQDFSPDEIAEKTLDIYRRVLDSYYDGERPC